MSSTHQLIYILSGGCTYVIVTVRFLGFISSSEECLVLAVKQEATSSIQRRLVHFFLSWNKKRDREVLDLSYT
jgi:hypothetical protein